MNNSKDGKGQSKPGLSQKLKPGRLRQTHEGYSFITGGTLPEHRIYPLYRADIRIDEEAGTGPFPRI